MADRGPLYAPLDKLLRHAERFEARNHVRYQFVGYIDLGRLRGLALRKRSLHDVTINERENAGAFAA